MRKVYWYSPFVEIAQELDYFVTEGNKYQLQNSGALPAGKVKRYIDCNKRNPPLAGLSDGDRLYVAAHGDTQAGFLAADKPGAIPQGYTNLKGRPALTPEQLLAKMEGDGCDWKITDIRIYACKAALGDGSFVQRLAGLIHAKNAKIVIFGYIGVLDRSMAPPNKGARMQPGTQARSPSELRRKFNVKPKLPDPTNDAEDLDDLDPFAAAGAQVWTVSPLAMVRK